MKNNIVRLLSAVLSLALLPACLLCACKPGSNGGDTTPAEESTGTPEPRLLTVVDKGEAKLEIVRPEEKTSGIMTRFGQALRTKLGNYFQTYFTLSEDWYNENLSGVTPPKERYEILIGATNRAESKAAISELAAGEYIIRVTDRKVVIAGYDNNALAVALRYFFVEMCKYSDYSDSETNSLAFPIGLEVKKSAGASDLKSIIRSGSDLTGELVSRVFKSSGGQYQYAQGGACDGEYIYLVYMKNDVGVIKKVRMSDWTLVATSEQINTGHGNDMTYDANNNRLVLVNMADNMITFISPETLGVIGTKKLNYPSYAIAYNTSTGGYAIASGGVKQSACTENLIGRIVEFLLGNVGQDVQRIGYYNDDSLPGVVGDLLHDIIHDVDIFLQKHHAVPGITRLDAGACSHHDDLGVRALLVAAHMDIRIGAVGERRGVAGVQHLAQGLFLVAVHHHDLIQDIHPQNRIQNRASHLTGADDYHFSI